tara:strand:+ start:4551 stop:5687 length:1137 start_codon:yes stop_codon:yes gene_type:complete
MEVWWMNDIAEGPEELTDAQKRTLYRDGFVVLKGVVPKEMTHRARRLANITAGKILNGTMEAPERRNRFMGAETEITDLINKTAMSKILQSTMGPFDPPTHGFSPVLYPVESSDDICIHGVADRDVPWHGCYLHLDGQWTGPIPQRPDEVDDWHVPGTPHFGDRSAKVIGTNGTPFFQDPACTLSLGSFTTFVGVALSDQSVFGYGNFAVLKGAHHHTAAFIRQQREKGGVIGPEGYGWPRLRQVGDRVGLNYLPAAIAEPFKANARYTPDGAMWLEPTPLLVEEGDTWIALHGVPHSATRNDAGADPRISAYFRLRRHRPDGVPVRGDSDHPDRGWEGEFLAYPEGYDPWKVAIERLCDPWSEWDGMKEVVAAEGKA